MRLVKKTLFFKKNVQICYTSGIALYFREKNKLLKHFYAEDHCPIGCVFLTLALIGLSFGILFHHNLHRMC